MGEKSDIGKRGKRRGAVPTKPQLGRNTNDETGVMKDWLFGALGALTIFAPERGREDSRGPEEQALFLIAFPIIGFLIFGVSAWLIVRFTAGPLPVFAAWAVPAIWVLLSGGRHLLELYRAGNALFYSGTQQERIELLSKNVLGVRALAFVFFVISGKMCALYQAQFLDAYSIGMLVLLVPMFSRYVSAIVALTVDNLAPGGVRRNVVVFLSSAVVVLVSASVFAMGLLLVVVSMLIAVATKAWFERRLGTVKPGVSSVAMELSEVSMLWAVALSSGLGFNPAIVF